MSKTTIPTGGITADAIDATLIADDAISDEHIDITAITGQTALAEAPAGTDEFLISDGGVLKRLDASYIGGTNTPNFSATRNSNQTSVSDATITKIQFNNVQYDTASGWDSSNYWWVVPSGQGGKYYISWSAYCSSGGYAYIDDVNLILYGGNGTTSIDVVAHSSHNSNFDLGVFKGSGIYALSVGDKINVAASINHEGGTARIDGSGTWNYTHLQLAKIIE